MTKAQITRRQAAASAALGSVRAEGLKPSAKTVRMINAYAEGKITSSDLAKFRKSVIAELSAKNNKYFCIRIAKHWT